MGVRVFKGMINIIGIIIPLMWCVFLPPKIFYNKELNNVQLLLWFNNLAWAIIIISNVIRLNRCLKS